MVFPQLNYMMRLLYKGLKKKGHQSDPRGRQ